MINTPHDPIVSESLSTLPLKINRINSMGRPKLYDIHELASERVDLKDDTFVSFETIKRCIEESIRFT